MRGNPRAKKAGRNDRSETFDGFLAKDGLLRQTGNAAIEEIIADQARQRRILP
jgi:hypothetical protein